MIQDNFDSKRMIRARAMKFSKEDSQRKKQKIVDRIYRQK